MKKSIKAIINTIALPDKSFAVRVEKVTRTSSAAHSAPIKVLKAKRDCMDTESSLDQAYYHACVWARRNGYTIL